MTLKNFSQTINTNQQCVQLKLNLFEFLESSMQLKLKFVANVENEIKKKINAKTIQMNTFRTFEMIFHDDTKNVSKLTSIAKNDCKNIKKFDERK